jgi:hypothetical protein
MQASLSAIPEEELEGVRSCLPTPTTRKSSPRTVSISSVNIDNIVSNESQDFLLAVALPNSSSNDTEVSLSSDIPPRDFSEPELSPSLELAPTAVLFRSTLASPAASSIPTLPRLKNLTKHTINLRKWAVRPIEMLSRDFY